jgi:transcriptional regulator with XRE-family HTH domain
MSQLDLACEANISTRHLSFIETGRSQPSREMILQIAETLKLPLRERNQLLLAGGFAPVYPERRLEDPSLDAARRAIDAVLSGHEPNPALAIDRHWKMIAANRALAPLLSGVSEKLLAPPINVLRVALHPEGLGRRVLNFREWQRHLIVRLRHQFAATGDSELSEMIEELGRYEPARLERPTSEPDYGSLVVPLKLETSAGLLSLFSTTTVFGTPLDVTLSEIAIETFFPADAESAERLRNLCAAKTESAEQ